MPRSGDSMPIGGEPRGTGPNRNPTLDRRFRRRGRPAPPRQTSSQSVWSVVLKWESTLHVYWDARCRAPGWRGDGGGVSTVHVARNAAAEVALAGGTLMTARPGSVPRVPKVPYPAQKVCGDTSSPCFSSPSIGKERLGGTAVHRSIVCCQRYFQRWRQRQRRIDVAIPQGFPTLSQRAATVSSTWPTCIVGRGLQR